MIKVVIYGLGTIGIKVARHILESKDLKLLGVVDISSDKVGKCLGELMGIPVPNLKVEGQLQSLLKKVKPDVVILTTSSRLKSILNDLDEIVKARVNVVSSAEELFFPWYHHKELAMKIDLLAKENGVRVLGTGVNPGFVMDELVLSMASICTKVDRVRAERVVDASERRLPLQKKIGAGMKEIDFSKKVEKKELGHVGLVESVACIAYGLGWKLDSIHEQIVPVIAQAPICTKHLSVAKGEVAGIKHQAKGKINGEDLISLELQMYLGAKKPYDGIFIEGKPGCRAIIQGGIHGDVATVAKLVNSIPRVLQGEPGLVKPLSMNLVR